jgi:hypothetical protein
LTTFTCEKADSGSSETTCDSNCADETPAALLGLWRGLNVQTGFTKVKWRANKFVPLLLHLECMRLILTLLTSFFSVETTHHYNAHKHKHTRQFTQQGEYVMNFTESTAAWGVYGDPVQTIADVAAVGPSQLRLTITFPTTRQGDVVYASYGNPGYPTGPETQSMSLAVQTGDTHQAPPQDVRNAMGMPEDFDVLVLNRCNAWDTEGSCDFSSSFETMSDLLRSKMLQASAAAAAAKQQPKKKEDVQDSVCSGFSDCDSCLDGGATCGWCDGQVVDTDGNVICGEDGQGCCGGDAEFSTCNVAFRKTCPVLCDYVYSDDTQGTTPTCRTATTPEYQSQTTYQDCDAMPWCTTEIYQYCDTDREECKTLYSTADCEAEPECDPSNPVCGDDCKQTSYIWCDDVLGCQSTNDEAECDANPDCDTSNPSQACDPTVCVASTFYTCDESSFTCKVGVGPAPDNSFNTTEECTAACVDTDLSGVWRAIAINSGYEGDEWDFSLTNTAITWSSPDGTKTSGTYVIGSPITESDYKAAEITVTLSSGEALVGIISNDRDQQSALGPVTQFIYLGLPAAGGSAIASFDAGMGAVEFVMVACLDDGTEVGCDFSSASPV